MATTTRRSAKSGTKVSETAAPAKPKFPTITLADGTVVPDVVEMRKQKMKWDDIVVLTRQQGQKLWDLQYVIEPIKDPSLKFKATGPKIQEAREEGLRWERIAARTGEGVTAVRRMFEEHTGMSADTSYVKKGRRFVPMIDGLKPVGYKETMVFDSESGKWVPKDGAKQAKTAPNGRTRKVKATTAETAPAEPSEAKPARRPVRRKRASA